MHVKILSDGQNVIVSADLRIIPTHAVGPILGGQAVSFGQLAFDSVLLTIPELMSSQMGRLDSGRILQNTFQPRSELLRWGLIPLTPICDRPLNVQGAPRLIFQLKLRLPAGRWLPERLENGSGFGALFTRIVLTEKLYVWVKMGAECGVLCRRFLFPLHPSQTGV